MTQEEADLKIKSLLNHDFLDRLLEIGKLYGWSGDYVEIADFIKALHRLYGLQNVDLEPYQIEDIE